MIISEQASLSTFLYFTDPWGCKWKHLFTVDEQSDYFLLQNFFEHLALFLSN